LTPHTSEYLRRSLRTNRPNNDCLIAVDEDTLTKAMKRQAEKNLDGVAHNCKLPVLNTPFQPLVEMPMVTRDPILDGYLLH
jgi:hypothetical protein